MLEKPAIPDDNIIAVLQSEYSLTYPQLTFLPLGADANAAVYRATTANRDYFVKLRRGAVDQTSIAIPHLLREQGITAVIPPLATRVGSLWTTIADFTLILYPFVAGHNGFEVNLSDNHWLDLGQALKGVHTTPIPPSIAASLARENYSDDFRARVTGFQQQAATMRFTDPVAIKLAALLVAKETDVTRLVQTASQLAAVLKSQPLEFVLCHSDIHAGNVLIDSTGTLRIVDWDQPVLAPKERDLMFVGGGIGSYTRRDLDAQEIYFYQGYGETSVNPVALAYYRCERIVQDIAAYCDQLLLTDAGGQDREVSFGYFISQFEPNAVIDVAYRTLASLPSKL
ncbi:MAG: aminoglycoside phosphotransferase family protein [Anaerolineae bacterium]|nr:aminoglycoside phosphotransferase family protein [Anaerolineae bacterium]